VSKLTFLSPYISCFHLQLPIVRNQHSAALNRNCGLYLPQRVEKNYLSQKEDGIKTLEGLVNGVLKPPIAEGFCRGKSAMMNM